MLTKERAREIATRVMQKAGNIPGIFYPLMETQEEGTMTIEELEEFCTTPPFGKELIAGWETSGLSYNKYIETLIQGFCAQKRGLQ
jgi:hypothetical protein